MNATDIADDIRGQLFADERNAAYITVDPLLDDPFDQVALTATHALYQLPASAFARHGLEQEELPYFIRLNGPFDEVLDVSVEVARRESLSEEGARRICGWFVTKETPQPIVERMKSGVARRNDRGIQTLVRMYDPRVLRHWRRIFGPGITPGDTDCWWYFSAPNVLDTAIKKEDCESPKTWTPAQWRAVERISHINHAINICQTMEEPVSTDTFGFIDRHVEQAVKLGLIADADIVSFALHRHLIHRQIEKHPTIKASIDETLLGHASYASHTATLSDIQWQQIKSGEWFVVKDGEDDG